MDIARPFLEELLPSTLMTETVFPLLMKQNTHLVLHDTARRNDLAEVISRELARPSFAAFTNYEIAVLGLTTCGGGEVMREVKSPRGWHTTQRSIYAFAVQSPEGFTRRVTFYSMLRVGNSSIRGLDADLIIYAKHLTTPYIYMPRCLCHPGTNGYQCAFEPIQHSLFGGLPPWKLSEEQRNAAMMHIYNTSTSNFVHNVPPPPPPSPHPPSQTSFRAVNLAHAIPTPSPIKR